MRLKKENSCKNKKHGLYAKGYSPEITLSLCGYGYATNEDASGISSMTSDGFYIPSSYSYLIVSVPGTDGSYIYNAGNGKIEYVDVGTYNVRLVVCLSSSIPAVAGTTTVFSLVE